MPLKSPFKDFTESVTPATAPGPLQHQAQAGGPAPGVLPKVPTHPLVTPPLTKRQLCAQWPWLFLPCSAGPQGVPSTPTAPIWRKDKEGMANRTLTTSKAASLGLVVQHQLTSSFLFPEAQSRLTR